MLANTAEVAARPHEKALSERRCVRHPPSSHATPSLTKSTRLTNVCRGSRSAATDPTQVSGSSLMRSSSLEPSTDSIHQRLAAGLPHRSPAVAGGGNNWIKAQIDPKGLDPSSTVATGAQIRLYQMRAPERLKPATRQHARREEEGADKQRQFTRSSRYRFTTADACHATWPGAANAAATGVEEGCVCLV